MSHTCYAVIDKESNKVISYLEKSVGDSLEAQREHHARDGYRVAELVERAHSDLSVEQRDWVVEVLKSYIFGLDELRKLTITGAAEGTMTDENFVSELKQQIETANRAVEAGNKVFKE